MAPTKTRSKAARKAGKASASKSTVSSNGAGKREAQRAADRDLMEKVVAMREDDKSWEEIATKLKIQTTKALFLYTIATVRPKDRIKGLDGATVVRLRDDEGLAWHVIAARTYAAGDEHSVSVARVKSMYKEESGREARGRLSSNGDSAPSKKAARKGGKRRGRKAAASRPS